MTNIIEPPTAAPSAQQNPPPQPNAPPRNPMMGPGVMLGSITIPDGTPAPNINQVKICFSQKLSILLKLFHNTAILLKCLTFLLTIGQYESQT